MSRSCLANVRAGAAIVLALAGGAVPRGASAEVEPGTLGDRAWALIERSRATLPPDAALAIGGHAYDAASRTLTLTGVTVRSARRELVVPTIDCEDLTGGTDDEPLVARRIVLHRLESHSSDQVSARAAAAEITGADMVRFAEGLRELALADHDAPVGDADLGVPPGHPRTPFDTLTVTDIAVATSDAAVSLKSALVALVGDGDGGIASVRLQLSEGTIDPEPASAGAAMLGKLGYGAVRWSAELDWSFDAAGASTLSLSLRAADVADLKIALGLTEIPEALAASAPSAADPVLAAAGQLPKLQRFSLLYEDRSLAGRILDQSAAESGQTRDEVVRGYAKQVGELARVAGPDGQRVAAALETFLMHPGTFVLSIEPDAPLDAGPLVITTMTGMPGPGGPANDLHLKVEAR